MILTDIEFFTMATAVFAAVSIYIFLLLGKD